MSSFAGLCAAESPCLVLSGEMGGGAQPDYNSSRLGVREREELCHYTAKRRGVGSEKRSKLLCTLLEVRHSTRVCLAFLARVCLARWAAMRAV